MYVREWNPSGSKTAVLVHGLASSSITWHRLAQDLAEHDYRVIAPDLTGHGKSPWLGYYSIENWSQDIINLGITEPDLMMGHSIGGLIAANVQPNLKPKKLILLDPMFNFPRIKAIAWMTKTIFRMNLEGATKAEVVPQSKTMKWTNRDVKIALQNMRRWDSTTTRTLNYRPDIVKRFMNTVNEALILRAKGSFLVPKSWEQRMDLTRMPLITFKTSHNIHIDAYQDFWDCVEKFLNSGTHKNPTVTTITTSTKTLLPAVV